MDVEEVLHAVFNTAHMDVLSVSKIDRFIFLLNFLRFFSLVQISLSFLHISFVYYKSTRGIRNENKVKTEDRKNKVIILK